MKVFMSHSSKNKLFVKELRKFLPESLKLWIDEKEIASGTFLNNSIKNAINAEADFLIIVLDNNSIQSDWVKQEIEWGLQREKELGRTFLLPLVLEPEAWTQLNNKKIINRKYLRCYEFTDAEIQATATNLIFDLFLLVSDLFIGNGKSAKQKNTLDLIDRADNFIEDIAEKIRLLVYPFRQGNPLELVRLLEMLKEQDQLNDIELFDFYPFIEKLQKQGHLTGLVSDGEFIWVKQEHHSWKTAIHIENKEKIAKKACSLISSGDTIALDSGSTTLEIAKQIAKGLKMNLWDDITVVTNSIPAAQALLSISSNLELKDKNTVLNVYMTEGRIRPNSLAVVNDSSVFNDTLSGFEEMLIRLGGADLCLIGANGLYETTGFAVHNDYEIKTKKAIIKESKKRYIVCDPSKFNIKEERKFVGFDEDITVITTNKGYFKEVKEFEQMILNTSTKLIIAS
jgi:DeoR/GlpR family transcriptional regulator of sugar metabolism